MERNSAAVGQVGQLTVTEQKHSAHVSQCAQMYSSDGMHSVLYERSAQNLRMSNHESEEPEVCRLNSYAFCPVATPDAACVADLLLCRVWIRDHGNELGSTVSSEILGIVVLDSEPVKLTVDGPPGGAGWWQVLLMEVQMNLRSPDLPEGDASRITQ